MFVWVIERTDYETEGCPENSTAVDEIVMGEDEEEVKERAEAREKELRSGAYALTDYYSYPVFQVTHV